MVNIAEIKYLLRKVEIIFCQNNHSRSYKMFLNLTSWKCLSFWAVVLYIQI